MRPRRGSVPPARQTNRRFSKMACNKMSRNHGGCLCGAVRYTTSATPMRVTVCHCKFCQRATGSAYMVEPIFAATAFEITSGTPSTYIHISEGSGKRVTIHFCVGCGTKLFLTFERFAEVCRRLCRDIRRPELVRAFSKDVAPIFLDSAQRGTVIPAGFKAYRQHATLNDGTAAEPLVFEQPHTISDASTRHALPSAQSKRSHMVDRRHQPSDAPRSR